MARQAASSGRTIAAGKQAPLALGQPSPCSAAITAACTRELTSSLRRMCCTWIFTVVSAMPSERADLLVALAERDAAQDLVLAWRQRAELRHRAGRCRRHRRILRRGRTPVGRHQLAGHLFGDHAFAAHRAPDRDRQCVALDRLEQVAAGAAAQGRGEVVFVFADRQHQHARARGGLEQRRQRVDAVDAGQVVVEQDQVGLQRFGTAQRFAGVARVADDLELRVALQQGRQAAPEQRVVVDDQDADVRRGVGASVSGVCFRRPARCGPRSPWRCGAARSRRPRCRGRAWTPRRAARPGARPVRP